MKLFKLSAFVVVVLGAAGIWFASCGHNGTLSSITIAPANTNMIRGSSLQFTATATFTDGTTIPWTLLTWSSSDTGVATVSNAAGSVGLASASSTTLGTTTITALDVANNISSTATITVAVPDSITVTPVNPGMAGGTSYQFTATANFLSSTPSTSQDITTAVTWTTNDQTVATVSPTGLVTTLSTGTTRTAIIAATGLIDTNRTGTTTLTVTPAVLSSVTVTPNPAVVSLSTGTTQQFTATATYADSTILDRTSSMIWSSSDTAVATIDNTGLATLAPGITTTVVTTITARDPITNIAGSAMLTVTP